MIEDININQYFTTKHLASSTLYHKMTNSMSRTQYLLGQELSWHCLLSSLSPAQSAPRYCGAGLVQVRLRTWYTGVSEHVTVHAVQLVQDTHPPSTDEKH